MRFLILIQKKLNVKDNICDLLKRKFEFSDKYEKLYPKEFHSKFEEYRVINRKEKTESINKKLSMLLNHEELSNLGLNKKVKRFLKL